MVEGDAGHLRLVGQVRVVADHSDDIRVELAPTPAPEQIHQAVVVARNEHRHALALTPVADLPLHRKTFGHFCLEARAEALAVGGQTLQEELGAQIEAPTRRVGRVLVGGDDVRPLLEQETRDRRDNSGLVCAVDQQARRIRRGLLLRWPRRFQTRYFVVVAGAFVVVGAGLVFKIVPAPFAPTLTV